MNPLNRRFKELVPTVPTLRPGAPLEVEIGCAEAQFLLERARIDPDRDYVGLEIRESLVLEVNEQAQAEDLPVQLIFCHANQHLLDLFKQESIDRVYLNFPDPWFKRRHHKRRMITPFLLEDVHKLLKPDGQLFFQSDVWPVALEVLSYLETLRHYFRNTNGSWAFHMDGNPFGARSWREQHCEEEGLPIWRILCDKA